MAPGAKLDTVSVGDGANILWPLDGFDYMNVNLDGNTIGDTGNVNYFYFNNSSFNKGLAHAASLSFGSEGRAGLR